MAAAPPPNPGLFFETVNAHHRTAVLCAALDLDLFTAIGDSPSGAASIAQRCGASPRGARILCDCLTAMGFLEKTGALYSLTPDSAALLDRRSPLYIGSAARFFGAPEFTAPFQNLAAIARNPSSGAALDSLAPDHPVWVEFARSMAPMMRFLARLMARLAQAEVPAARKVLDVACGHGMFGISAAELFPEAEVTGLDWPAVVAVALDNARAAGLAARYHALPGSALEVGLGSGFDLVLITNCLHHWSVSECEGLLRRIHAAMNPGGCVLTLDFIPNEDRVSPPTQAMFAAIMLATTPEGEAYTFADYESMFSRAGFRQTRLANLNPSQRVLVSRR